MNIFQAFDTDHVEVGLIDNVKYKERFPIGDGWIAVKLVVKFGECLMFSFQLYSFILLLHCRGE